MVLGGGKVLYAIEAIDFLGGEEARYFVLCFEPLNPLRVADELRWLLRLRGLLV